MCLRRTAAIVLLTLSHPFLGVDAQITRADDVPRNIVLVIADGMGPEQVELTRIWLNGDTAPLNFETLPHIAMMTTENASGGVTDSAAAGTAMATGNKVDNGVISLRIPGDGSELPTVLELFSQRQKSTGIVVHSASLVDATSAAFIAHEPSRYDLAAIERDFLDQSRPNVLLGQDFAAFDEAAARLAGYEVAHDASTLESLSLTGPTHLIGIWPPTAEPSLQFETEVALDLLDDNPAGFFLLVHEQGPDLGGHANSRSITRDGVLSVVSAVDTILSWALPRSDTLIVVTSDHETGGLSILENHGAGILPTVSWSTASHTSQPVNVFASSNVTGLSDRIDNTELFRVLYVPELYGGPLFETICAACMFSLVRRKCV